MNKPRKRSRPTSIFPPVLIFLCAIFGAVLIDFVVWPSSIAQGNPIRLFMGAVLLVMGAVLWLLAWREFRRHGETFSHKYATEKVVTSGPYRISRHPTYLAYAVMTAGLALASDNAWLLLFLPFVVLIVDSHAAKREERYLMAKHEAAYRPYRLEVRRWI
jgi:protein-S-isoprenylcysteine O-methyltransferase Ste14